MNKQISKLSPSELKSLVERGILRVTMSNGKIPTKIEETPEYQQFKHLKGKKIHIGEASRKYDIPNPTITRWKHKGFLKVLGTDGQKILLDESYVAYCAYVYCQSPGSGRWAFTKDGLPRSSGVDLRNV